jgi:integrase
MSRPNKVWFRKDVGWWMVTLGGKKIRLAEGRQNKKIAEQKYHELAAVRTQAPESATARVADVIEAFLAWSKLHRSDETNRNYLWFGQAFSEHSGDLVASELKPIHLTRWIDAEAWGQTTQRNARRSIYRAFSWACEEGILSRNPLNGMRCPRARARARIVTDAEYRALLKNSDGDFKVLLFALKETGCRPKEARVLKWEHVQADRWILPEHKTAYKVAKPRVIYLTSCMQKLMRHLRRRSTSDHVFLNARAKPWTRNAIRLRIMRLKKKLGLATDLCAYLFRHAFATNALLNGVDCASVAELLGHADVTMVAKIYGHLAGQHKHLGAAVERATRPLVSATPLQGESHRGG